MIGVEKLVDALENAASNMESVYVWAEIDGIRFNFECEIDYMEYSDSVISFGSEDESFQISNVESYEITVSDNGYIMRGKNTIICINPS